MSQNEILYVKGMDLDESQSEEDDGNVWDDRKLNNAYDKAIKIVNIEVAKRIAMSTNTQTETDSKQNQIKPKKEHPKKKTKKINWKAGMSCRALYDEDGLEYEAVILSILNDRECIVQFSEYDNLQKVELSSLHPTINNHQKTQYSKLEKDDDGFESQSPYGDDAELGATAHVDSIKQIYERVSSDKKRNKQKSRNNSFTLPDIPMPDMSMIRNMGGIELPFPPPPPQLGEIQDEQQAVSSMLLSWYMSGYYTGLYQGMKKAKEDIRRGK
ncbi:survival motor neuron protein isoform X1 [Pieris brassicae]|uniref:survival motor neuron protein isoform X1 n=2 Tax=Pieris brassicae TaxID=7116 RepID=UPI001E65FCD3|nr:survival motor neuron protein isoform X1 [Pieris brassicae]